METLRAIAQNVVLGISAVRRRALHRHVTGIDGDPQRARELFEFYREQAAVADREVLELGPGKTLEVLDLAREAGAASVAAADIVPYHDRDAAAARGIDYRVYDGRRLPFADASFDLVWACYCMQHFRHPELAVADVARVLRPGGRLVCRIDLRDHYHMFEPGRQYDCLRHAPWTWRMMAWNRGSYVNRLRASQWLALLAAAGLHAERTTPHRDATILAQNRGHAYLAHLSDDDLLTYRLDGVFARTGG